MTRKESIAYKEMAIKDNNNKNNKLDKDKERYKLNKDGKMKTKFDVKKSS